MAAERTVVPTPDSRPTQRPSTLVPVALAVAGLLLGLLAAFLAWFVISGSSVALLPDSYHSMYVYGMQGSSALKSSNALGATLVGSSTSDPVVLIAFAIILFFWPAMLVSGLYSVLARSFTAYPAVWGLIAFVFAYVLVYKAGATLGVGAWLALVAAVLFLAAAITGRFARTKPAPAESSAAGSPSAASVDSRA